MVIDNPEGTDLNDDVSEWGTLPQQLDATWSDEDEHWGELPLQLEPEWEQDEELLA